MHSVHPNARTTPAVRAEIARSSEPTGVLARRYGVSTETIRKWRKRGPHDCQDRSAHVLTDRGSCFTADGFEAACREVAVQHRTTRPYTPKTNGMVERFNGRVQREVLGITIHSHADLETLLKGFNRAYNARRQRVLGGISPDAAAQI